MFPFIETDAKYWFAHYMKRKDQEMKTVKQKNGDRNIYLSVDHITSMAPHTGSTESNMSQNPVPYKLWRQNVTRQA